MCVQLLVCLFGSQTVPVWHPTSCLWTEPLRFDYHPQSPALKHTYEVSNLPMSPQPLPDSPQAQNQEGDNQGPQSLLPAQIRFDADSYLQSWIHPAALVLYGMESPRPSLFQQHRFSLNRPHFKASLITESHSDTCNVKRGTGAETPSTLAVTFPTLEVCTLDTSRILSLLSRDQECIRSTNYT